MGTIRKLNDTTDVRVHRQGGRLPDALIPCPNPMTGWTTSSGRNWLRKLNCDPAYPPGGSKLELAALTAK